MASTPYTEQLRSKVQSMLASVQQLEELGVTEADDLTWLGGHTAAKLADLDEELDSLVEWVFDGRKLDD